MLINNINAFIGAPSARIKQWIIENQGTQKSEWEKLVEKLESFDTSAAPQSQGLPAVGSLLSTAYMISDGYTDGNEFVQCLTKDSVMQNISKIKAVNIPWVVLGYDGTVPQYVKYKNGKNYVYVSSVDDTISEYGFLREITAGCKTYVRSWSDETLKSLFTNSGKTITNVGSQTFTYGTTNENCGTKATTAGGYAVPMSIVVEGIEYEFCGHTMALQTKHLLGSSRNGATVTEDTCAFSYGERLGFRTRWSDSHIRAFLNFSRCGHNQIPQRRFEVQVDDMIKHTNGIGLKLAKEKGFLKCCPPTIARNYVYEEYRSGGAQLDDNYVEYTANDFILAGSANLNGKDTPFVKSNELEDFAIFNVVYPIETEVGGPNPTQTDALKKFVMADINGNVSEDAKQWFTRSASAFDSDSIITVEPNGRISNGYTSTRSLTISPICSIY